MFNKIFVLVIKVLILKNWEFGDEYVVLCRRKKFRWFVLDFKRKMFWEIVFKKEKNLYFRVFVISILFLKIIFWIIDGRK